MLAALATCTMTLIVGGCTSTQTVMVPPPELSFASVRGESAVAATAQGASTGASQAQKPASDSGEGEREIKIAAAGATMVIPSDWVVTPISISGDLSTLKAGAPDGTSLRVDETLSWGKRLVDSMAEVNDLETRLSTKYKDFRTVSKQRIDVGGLSAVRWEFTNTDSDGRKMRKVDVFWQESAASPPMAAVVAWPDNSESSGEVALAILDSLVP